MSHIFESPWVVTPLQFAKLLFLTLVAAEAVARIGSGIGAMLGTRRRSALERLGTGYLLGLPCLGTALYGLALNGIFYNATIVALPILLIAAAWEGPQDRGLFLVRAYHGLERPGLATVLLAIPCAGVAAFFLMLPDLQQDSYIYHLGAPWQFLMAHRAVFDWMPFAFALPFPVEMNYVYPIISDDDRLAKWLGAFAFVAASCVWVSQRRKGDRNGWLAPLFALSSYYALYLLPESKNDMAASSMFVAGLIMIIGKKEATGLALLGACAGAKYVHAPLAGLVALGLARPHHGRGKFLLLAIPIMPWIAGAWLATGDPVYPHGFRWFPNLTWNANNNEAFLSYVLPIWPADTMSLVRVPGAWIRFLLFDNMALLALVPLAMVRAGVRLPLLLLAAGQVLTLAIFHHPRYLIPSMWALCLLSLAQLERLAGKRMAWAAAILALYAGCRVVFLFSGNEARTLWRDAITPPRVTLERRLTTYGEMIRHIGREPGAGRLLTIGELRTYRIPARVIYGGGLGETPLAWKLAREARDPAEIRTRMRQLGITRIAYNYVNANWIGLYSGSFQWDKRSLRLYVEFCKRYLIMRGMSATDDNNNGGFAFYGIANRPVSPVPATIWFAPGSETAYSGLDRDMRERNSPADVLPGFLAAQSLMPDVGYAWNRAGHIYALLKDFPNTFRLLDRFGREGMVDDTNLLNYAAAAIQTGRLDLAETILDRALARYTDRRPLVRLDQASVFMQRAIREVMSNRSVLAGKYADLGLERIAEARETDPLIDRNLCRLVHAFLLGIRASVLKSRGKLDEAISAANEGLAIMDTIPNDPAKINTGFRATSHAFLLTAKAMALEAAGDIKQAGDLYITAVRLYPGDRNAPQWLTGARRCGVSTKSATFFPSAGK